MGNTNALSGRSSENVPAEDGTWVVYVRGMNGYTLTYSVNLHNDAVTDLMEEIRREIRRLQELRTIFDDSHSGRNRCEMFHFFSVQNVSSINGREAVKVHDRSTSARQNICVPSRIPFVVRLVLISLVLYNSLRKSPSARGVQEVRCENYPQNTKSNTQPNRIRLDH